MSKASKKFFIVVNGNELKTNIFDFNKAKKLARQWMKKGAEVFVYDERDNIVFC